MSTKIIGIPFGQCFLESLAKILLEQATDPLDLAQTLVLLPTKRGVLNLQEAFRKTSSFLMLPRMMALADISSENPLLLASIDDLPPSISSWKRLGLFTQLILKFQPDYTVNRALKAAKSLMHLVDEAETTGIDLNQLENLVAEDYAEHWQTTLGFLKIITHHWPEILRELQVIEPQTKVRQALLALSNHWLSNPPDHKVVIAGTTGTVPATTELIKTILSLSKGLIVLPGYDANFTDARKVLTHPQHTLENLVSFLCHPSLSSSESHLSSSDLFRGSIDSRNKCENDNAIHIQPHSSALATDRQSLIHASMDNKTLDLDPSFDPTHFPEMIECDTIAEEAKVIALMMRYYLEEITRTIALVSPNQGLCRLVEAELDRFDLGANSSGGTPLNQTVVGSFLLVIAELWRLFDVSHLLTVLKHPLCMKNDRHAHLENVRRLEKDHLRHPDFNMNDLWSLLPSSLSFLSSSDLFRGSIDSRNICENDNVEKTSQVLPLTDLLTLHQNIALKLVGDNTEDSRLWQQNDGIAAQKFFDDLKEHSHFPPLSFKSYPSFFATLMQESSPVRKYKGIGSRLVILGALEARLSDAEVIILGGLNENSWPPAIDPDPWLSRSMRQTLGLPAPERRIGLSAHDFCSCFYAKHLLLTRSHSDNGAPTLPSRWWQRLETVRAKNSLVQQGYPWKVWVKSLRPVLDPIKIQSPKPCPSVNIRPKKLSVTEIEKLMRDPYSIYAKHCLKLNPLLSLHQPLNPAEKGQIIHKILEEHIESKDNSLSQLLDRARPHFLYNPVSRVFWWHRFEQIADWFLVKLAESNIKECLTEQRGRVSFKNGFEITAIADRIDYLDETTIRMVDYKTGTPPSKNDMKMGYSPQLVLEALMASKDGFGVLMTPIEIAIWHLRGGDPAGNIISLPITEEFLDYTEENLLKLLEIFQDPNTPYLACPVPEKAPLYNNYAHLERLLEWG